MIPPQPTGARRRMPRRQLLTLGAFPAAPARAQAATAFPSKAIRLVVPFPAGGGTARRIALLGDAVAA